MMLTLSKGSWSCYIFSNKGDFQIKNTVKDKKCYLIMINRLISLRGYNNLTQLCMQKTNKWSKTYGAKSNRTEKRNKSTIIVRELG